MKKVIFLSKIIIFVVFIAATTTHAQSQTSNSISGFVFDAATRGSVPEVYVELLDDVYMTLRRTKTDGSGRYFFGGISSGNFKVKVLPYGTNFLEEIHDAVITNYSFGNVRTSDNVYLDIYLKLDKRKININELNPAASVFVQDIPVSARNLYKKGSSQLEKSREAAEGFENIKKALEIFPDYYEALDKIGTEYVKRQQYFEALPFLVKSITVNQRSFSSFYMLGLAAFNLKQIKEATDAFRAATIINPQSIYAHLQYGMVLRIGGNYKQAEEMLLKAESLSKNAPVGTVYWQMALLYHKLDRFENAAAALEKYLKFQPGVENTQQVKDLIKQLKAKTKAS
jgi:tetratricopeptide (TPR) repeat protein